MTSAELLPTVLQCSGCAAVVDPSDPTVDPFRCPNATRAPNIDHVLGWSPIKAGLAVWPSDTSLNPFVRYRTLQHSYWYGRSLGRTDDDHLTLVHRLDRAVHSVAGIGFNVTPFQPIDSASEAFGVEVWAKHDTVNVAGSHKARHLFGTLLHLELRRVPTRARLAIASCGNAALAAATLARAARRPLEVYVPVNANPAVRMQLDALSAHVHECGRRANDSPGDPCLHRFHEAISGGALPFCVQGSENGLCIDGGCTMGHELADQLDMVGWVPDRLLIQVGGGALGTSVARGLSDAVALGVLPGLPKLHFVQTEGCAPLARAWTVVTNRALSTLGKTELADHGADAVATALAQPDAKTAVDEALRFAATHRKSVMWPWAEEPKSIATGILDDETYDWYALVEAMLRTGGWPIVVEDRDIEKAVTLAATSPAPNGAVADETGASGLAGAVWLHRNGLLRPAERIVTILSGVRRA